MKVFLLPCYLGFLALLSGPARADVVLPALLSDHAVLQRSDKTRVWGKADPGEQVHVTLSDATGKVAENQAQTDAKGRWQLTLDLSKAGPGPFTLSAEGKNKATASDVVIGEVWLCAGQSNMEFCMRGDFVERKTDNPMIRQFHVPIDRHQREPQDDCGGVWVLANPTTLSDGIDPGLGFSAVGYYFAKKLNTTLNEPVGIILSAVKGTAIEFWTSAEGFEKDPEWNEIRLKKIKNRDDFDSTKWPKYLADYKDWSAKYGREDKPADPTPYISPDISMDGWKPVQIPGSFSAAGLTASGAVWIRKSITIPSKGVMTAGTRCELRLGTGSMHDYFTIYFNGYKVAETSPAEPIPQYFFTIPGEHVKAGENILAIRMFSAVDDLGIETDATGRNIRTDFFQLDSTNYWTGTWMAKEEESFPLATPEMLSSYPKPPGQPSEYQFLYNGMIAPITHATVKGILWYQGEANYTRAYKYATSFPIMIQDWREHFSDDLPFYFVQLAGFRNDKTNPVSGWTEIRESQAKALSLPKTGMAVAIDVGEEANLHPLDKKTPAERLARIAFAKNYGKADAYSGPTYDSMKIEGSGIRITFKNSDGGLVAKPLPDTYKPFAGGKDTKPLVRSSPNSPLEGFAICGEDKNWNWADAKIEGNDIIVSSSKVAKPIAVRYGWEDFHICNLYNGADLPAAPFRTDDFPLITESAKW